MRPPGRAYALLGIAINNTMTKIITLLLIVIAGLVGYKKHYSVASEIDTSRYSLSKVEEQPIPKAVLFILWKEVGLQHCSDAAKNHSLTPEQCKEIVSQRHGDCERSSMENAPELISDQAITRRLGRQYLRCVTPYYFCKGIEVRTEEEAKRYCQ